MTPTQQKIWSALPANGRYISTSAILALVWPGYGTPQNLRVQIHHIRRVLANEGSKFTIESRLGPGSWGYRRVKRAR